MTYFLFCLLNNKLLRLPDYLLPYVKIQLPSHKEILTNFMKEISQGVVK